MIFLKVPFHLRTSIAEQLSREGTFFPIHVNLEYKETWDLEKILKDLFLEICQALSLPNESIDSDTDFATTFKKNWLPNLLPKLPSENGLVFLFDELDIWAGIGKEDKGAIFFPYLNDLLSIEPKKLKFVFVIARQFDRVNENARRLFRKISIQQVSLFDRNEAEQLVRFSERNNDKTLKWSIETIEKIWEQTHGHPYLIQSLCKNIWDNIYDNKPNGLPAVKPQDVEEAIKNILEQTDGGIEWLWDGLQQPAEKLVASALVNISSGPVTKIELNDFLSNNRVPMIIQEQQDAIALLQNMDFIEFVNGGYRFRVKLLQIWIAKHKSIEQVQDELDRTDQEAHNFFEAAWRLYSNYKRLHDNKQLESALDNLRDAVRLNPRHATAIKLLVEIAETLFEEKQIDQAHEILEQLYKYNPDIARSPLVKILFTLAQIHHHENEKIRFYKRVLELEPENSEAKSKLQNLVSSDLVEAALLLAEYSDNDDERLMLYKRVLKLEPNHKIANEKRQTILQRQDKHVEKNTYLESQVESLNTILEEKLSHINHYFDQKVENIKNSLNHTFQNSLTQTNTKQIEKKTSWFLISLIVITLIILILEGVQILTPGKLEKAVVKQESITVSPGPKLEENNPSFEVLKTENDSLKKNLELSKKEIQRLEEKLSPEYLCYKITSDDKLLVNIPIKCYGMAHGKREECVTLVKEYNGISDSGLIPGRYLFIPNNPEKGCLLENRSPLCPENKLSLCEQQK